MKYVSKKICQSYKQENVNSLTPTNRNSLQDDPYNEFEMVLTFLI